MTDKEIELEAISKFPMDASFSKAHTGIDIINAKREAWATARKQSLSELAEAKGEIEKKKREYDLGYRLHCAANDLLREEISSLKASLLKEVEDAWDAGYKHGWGQSEFEGESFTPNKSTYLNNLKERLNIQL